VAQDVVAVIAELPIRGELVELADTERRIVVERLEARGSAGGEEERESAEGQPPERAVHVISRRTKIHRAGVSGSSVLTTPSPTWPAHFAGTRFAWSPLDWRVIMNKARKLCAFLLLATAAGLLAVASGRG
jgi:hypothetical protein